MPSFRENPDPMKENLTLIPSVKPEDGSVTVGILQPGYLPWLGFFEQLYRSDKFVIYDDVQFDKGGWRNRNRIKTAAGLQWLTVPVLINRKNKPLINQVLINSTVNWQDKHIRSITQNYSKTPFFKNYSDELFELLTSYHSYLIELDMALIEWLCAVLNIETELVLSSDLNVKGDKIERLVGIINKLGGNQFYEGAAGKNYIDLGAFNQESIILKFQDYNHPVYRQQYGEFRSHLSIIDLLFNCGPESLAILTDQNVRN